MEFEAFLIDPDTYVRKRDLYDRISMLYSMASGDKKPSQRTIQRWINSLGLMKPGKMPYRGYEYNQLVFMVEGMIKTQSISVSVNVVQDLRSEVPCLSLTKN